MKPIKVSMVGVVGVPAKYGGFETVAENLIRYAHREQLGHQITVHCSTRYYAERAPKFLNAALQYLPLSANGKQSVIYDAVSLLRSINQDVVLVFGVSGALFLPFFRLISSAKVVVNVDGIESRREKWGRFARWFLKASEASAVRYSDHVIADNQAICNYIEEEYRRSSILIAYGGDHAIGGEEASPAFPVPERFCLGVCRIEPENNIATILRAFTGRRDCPLLMVGNWRDGAYGRELKAVYAGDPGLILLDPIYDMGVLTALRSRATCYVHGHSAGGTNPSLVEAMHFGMPIIAFDCPFNRYTMDGRGAYFGSSDEIRQWLDLVVSGGGAQFGIRELARQRYMWAEIGRKYFDLIDCCMVRC